MPLNLQKLGAFTLDPRAIRDISPLMLGPDRTLRIVPASIYESTTVEERAFFGVKNGFYSLPTLELVEYLKKLIGTRTAIEVGAGHGLLAQALGIPATDSFQQLRPDIRQYYEKLQQPIVPYGDKVDKLDALAAVKKYQPQVVIGCWVTHRYQEHQHDAGGNLDGLDEEALIKACETYVIVGNEKVHAGKSIWNLPHTKITPPWLFSRALNGTPDFIAIWENAK